MSVINISLYTPIGTKLKVKENTTTSISESFKLKEMCIIYNKLILNLQKMIDAENTYYNAKDKLVNELPMILRNENYEYGDELTNNINNAIKNIKSIYQDSEEDVNRLFELTQISDINFEKEYIFGFTENRTEMTLITGLKLLEQYLSN